MTRFAILRTNGAVVLADQALQVPGWYTNIVALPNILALGWLATTSSSGAPGHPLVELRNTNGASLSTYQLSNPNDPNDVSSTISLAAADDVLGVVYSSQLAGDLFFQSWVHQRRAPGGLPECRGRHMSVGWAGVRRSFRRRAQIHRP